MRTTRNHIGLTSSDEILIERIQGLKFWLIRIADILNYIINLIYKS